MANKNRTGKHTTLISSISYILVTSIKWKCKGTQNVKDNPNKRCENLAEKVIHMLPSHSLLNQFTRHKDTGLSIEFPTLPLLNKLHKPNPLKSLRVHPQQNHLLCIILKNQRLISERFQMRSREETNGQCSINVPNHNKSYLGRTLICLSLSVGIVVSLWRCNRASSATSSLVISGLVEYDRKSFSWGRIIHVPLTKFWQRTTCILLQMQMSTLEKKSRSSYRILT